MKRWNIEKLFLYSHDGRKKELEFKLSDVTIITGRSNTGKSAIIEIIDYAMGSKECHIPGIVRRCSSWVGVLWVKDTTQCVILRKVPEPSKKTNSEVILKIGNYVAIPNDISKVEPTFTNLDVFKKKIESLFGIGSVQTETYDSAFRSPVRISIRNLMPFLLQDDTTITNKNNLLRGADTERKQHIIDSLPYFLGIVDETFIETKGELRRLKRKYNQLVKKMEQDYIDSNNSRIVGINLLIEAIQVGLLNVLVEEINRLSQVEVLNLLKEIKNAPPTEKEFESKILLDDFYTKLRQIEYDIFNVRQKITSAIETIGESDEFYKSLHRQKHKLEVVKLIPNEEKNNVCPLCNSEYIKESTTIVSITNILNKINSELVGVQKERPKLDNYIQKLKIELEILKEDRQKIKEGISILLKENDSFEKQLIMDQRQNRTIGKITLFLDSIFANEPEGETSTDLNKIINRINELDDKVNSEKLNELLDNVRLRISKMATNIITKLPLDKRYLDCPVDFNLKTLTAGIITPYRREEMRDIGSDENYLSLHVALMLALHRHFAELNRPVPGVLIFDQLSRPFFPPDPSGEQEEIVLAEEAEKNELKMYFDYLFDEVQRQESMQIIILEHAYFEKDERFKRATKYRWNMPDLGLIPKDWPEYSESYSNNT